MNLILADFQSLVDVCQLTRETTKKELPPTIKNDKKEKKAGKAVQILQKIKRATQRQKEKEEIAAESESEDQFWEEEEEKSSDNK